LESALGNNFACEEGVTNAHCQLLATMDWHVKHVKSLHIPSSASGLKPSKTAKKVVMPLTSRALPSKWQI
jgi:hypothetical protein